jgi:hypothetical protein
MPVGDCHTGTYTGTGSAMVLELGFVPDHIRVINLTDGTAGAEWFAAVPAVTIALALTKVTSNGIGAYLGTAATSAGVTLGTTVTTSAKVFGYVASRSK